MASTPISANFPPVLPFEAPVCEATLESFVQAAERRRSYYLRLARRVTPCQAEAEDIVQDALLRAYRNLQRFRGEAQMTTWLQSIVQNSAREWLRDRRGARFVSMERDEESDSAPMDFPAPGRTPEENLEQSEMRDILMSEIGNLSNVCSQAIRMCALEGASQEEAANALQVSVAAIKARVFSAKRRLREGFEQRGILREI